MTKLLLITRNAWSNEISTGNTMSNFFADWQGEIANIFCRDEKIQNTICRQYFQITEGQLVQNILHKKETGKKILYDTVPDSSAEETETIRKEAKKYAFFRNHRLQLFLWGRELLWKCGKWKNRSLEAFLKEFHPDVILMPLYDCFYMYDILFHVQKYTGAAVALYSGDDMYTLKQWSFSPLYWIDRCIRRKKIRKAVQMSSFRFCLTEKQSREYTEIFDVPFETIMKSAVTKEEKKNKQIQMPLQFLYTGNVIPGRYKTLDCIGKALDTLNADTIRAEVHIYSGNTLSKKMERCFKHNGMIFHGSANYKKVYEEQEKADVVLHVEDFSVKNKLKTRLSLSTKIIDYLAKGKCILAIGPEDVASMEYLAESDAAICVTDKNHVENTLSQILENAEERIRAQEEKAMLCIRKNHNAEINRKKLYVELEKIANASCTN